MGERLKVNLLIRNVCSSLAVNHAVQIKAEGIRVRQRVLFRIVAVNSVPALRVTLCATAFARAFTFDSEAFLIPGDVCLRRHERSIAYLL